MTMGYYSMEYKFKNFDSLVWYTCIREWKYKHVHHWYLTSNP